MIELIIFIIIVILIILCVQRKEHYNLGTIDQLMAKDPQDLYLTGDAYKYVPPWYIDNTNYSDAGYYGGIGTYYGNPWYATYPYVTSKRKTNYPYYYSLSY